MAKQEPSNAPAPSQPASPIPMDDWLDSSHSTTDDGRPVSFFHGTHGDFTEFDFAFAKDGAHWFTTLESHAASFGPAKEFFLSIKNPMVITQTDLEDAWDVEHPSGEQDDRYLLPRDFAGHFVEKAKSLGHDGLIIQDMGDRDIQSNMFLPFRPDQIRRAGDYRHIPGVRLDPDYEHEVHCSGERQ
jgi:hypothetical protein